MPRKFSQNEIIYRFREVHGDRYDYSSVAYVNTSTKVDINCIQHGIFRVTPAHHLNGVGCRKCFFEKQKVTPEDFISRSSDLHGETNSYDFSSQDFPGTNGSIKIHCKIHDLDYIQNVSAHMNGHKGCPECKSDIQRGGSTYRGQIISPEKINDSYTMRAREVHGDTYDYSLAVYVNGATKITIICREHGAFHQTPFNHLKGHKCPKCALEKRKSGTFKARCKSLGIDYYRALKRREAGMPEDKIFEESYVRSTRPTKRAITVHGIEYPNLKEAVRRLNPPATPHTIWRWIEEGVTPEEAFQRVPNPGYENGIIYKITQLSTGKVYIGLTVTTLSTRWSNHLDNAKQNQITSLDSLHHAIRTSGEEDFSIEQVDTGVAKGDLEAKEIFWIRKFNSMAPSGFNLNAGGSSGGSNKKEKVIDGIRFPSTSAAAEYVSKSRSISLAAAEKRIHSGRVDVKSPSKKGESIVRTKEYKAWGHMIHSTSNPNSKDFIPDVQIDPKWRDFKVWRENVGDAPTAKHRFSRIDKSQGFFPWNCKWMTPSEEVKSRSSRK